jgi:ADP-L-glycero-D-manno-heptose 6-epimerase
MKKVLITGTEGFIGKNLKKFLEKDYWIFEINEDVFNSDEWRHNTLNLIDYIRPDVIFHIGACSNTLETDVNYMMTRNYEFTKMISNWSSNNKTF